jgi:hypothetical protein
MVVLAGGFIYYTLNTLIDRTYLSKDLRDDLIFLREYFNYIEIKLHIGREW